MVRDWRAARSTFVAGLAILGPTLLVLSYFPPSLMLAGTTASGGDLASHNYAASYARMLLFTRHRLTGWIPGNYFGFPLFQMYFPAPFAVMALLSLVLNANVAFKLVTILGVVALPAAAYVVLSRLKTPFPGPAIGASLVLLFLFQDGNSMWGGNLASTLAGEFAFSLSLPIALIYLGLYERALESTRTAAWCAVVIGALALTHANTVLWVALTSAIVVAVGRAGRPGAALQNVVRLILVFGGAGALCAFWLVPLLWYAPWTTAYKHIWVIQSVTEVLPRPLWPILAVAVAASALLAWGTWRQDEASGAYWRQTSLLHAALAAGAIEYIAAPNFGIVDVRFLPFVQLSLCLLAAAAAGHLLSRLPAPAVWIPVVFLGVTLLVQAPGARMGQWIQWDYEGFERKAQWPVYQQIADYLRGGVGDPRVVYEHSSDNEALGTIRAFEDLPLFSGRSTLEGVHQQASVTSPFVFYVQSEVSAMMSCPFAEWGCSRTNLASGIAHLKMMNVSDFIVRSTEVKALASDQPDLLPRTTIGSYNIYRIDHNRTGYAVALSAAPYVVTTKNWKEAAYRWFKHAGPDDPVPVFVSASDDAASVFANRAVPEPAQLKEQVEAERIVVDDCRPGQPILIRMSYHPRWRSTTGERVWLAGPGFMLVVPAGNRLELVYSETLPTIAGSVISIAAVLCFGLGLWKMSRARSQGPKDEGRPRTKNGPGTEAQGPRTTRWLSVLFALVAIGAGVRARQLDADSIYRSSQRRYDAGDLDGARAGFLRARDRAPLSNTAIHSSYYEAIILYRQKRWSEAKQAFERLVKTFPEAQAAAEATYHSGLCAEEMGDVAEARSKFADTERRFPDTLWAQLSQQHARDLQGR